MDTVELFKEKLKARPLVLIYRGLDAQESLEITQSLAEVGVRMFEVTMNTPGAVQTIKLLRERMGPEIWIGAGTVTTTEQVRQVSEAGAGFVISPNTNEEVIKTTKRLGMVSIPGAFTPTEILEAREAGGDIIKIFPVNVVGSEYIKQLRGPIQDIPFMATGGVRLDMVADLIREGVCSIGLSAHLLGRELIEKKDWKGLQQSALAYMAAAGSLREDGAGV